VTGVECRSLRGAPWWAGTSHRLLYRAVRKPYLYVPKLGRILHRPVGWLERRYGRTLLVGAASGVVIAAGGFSANRPMMRAHAPSARGGLPLATPGDDGSGILLGTGAGGAAALLDRVSVWRFLSPPPALLHGVLVDRDGKRICDESRYGAAIGDEIVRRGGGAWLLVDRATLAQARRQLRGSTLWFQRLQAWHLLTLGRVTADTLADVAARAGVDPDGLAATLAAYNGSAAAADGSGESPDPAGKPPDLVLLQDQPPYSLIDFSIRPRLWYPAPVLTLGGLVVDQETGHVLDTGGAPITGLYAAGRSAVGLCSRSYVSGLSIADCVFSGRRAGRHAATAAQTQELLQHMPPPESQEPPPTLQSMAAIRGGVSILGKVSEREPLRGRLRQAHP
jgi:3-oxo-5alpha-steroid 4-dehydrogenase